MASLTSKTPVNGGREQLISHCRAANTSSKSVSFERVMCQNTDRAVVTVNEKRYRATLTDCLDLERIHLNEMRLQQKGV